MPQPTYQLDGPMNEPSEDPQSPAQTGRSTWPRHRQAKNYKQSCFGPLSLGVVKRQQFTEAGVAALECSHHLSLG